MQETKAASHVPSQSDEAKQKVFWLVKYDMSIEMKNPKQFIEYL